MGSHKDPWPHDDELEARSGRLAEVVGLVVAAVLIVVLAAVWLTR